MSDQRFTEMTGRKPIDACGLPSQNVRRVARAAFAPSCQLPPRRVRGLQLVE